MDPIVEILSIGTLLLEASLILSVILFAASKSGYLEKYWEKLNIFLTGYWKQLSFGLALIATLGSLYMSNILGYAPCHLCWFQRIFMYPLVVLFGISWLLDTDVVEYAVPLTTVGGGIAAYHYVIQRIEQFSSAGCSITQVSCDTEYTFYLGIVTIPLMAFTAFLGILAINWKYGEAEF